MEKSGDVRIKKTSFLKTSKKPQNHHFCQNLLKMEKVEDVRIFLVIGDLGEKCDFFWIFFGKW